MFLWVADEDLVWTDIVLGADKIQAKTFRSCSATWGESVSIFILHQDSEPKHTTNAIKTLYLMWKRTRSLESDGIAHTLLWLQRHSVSLSSHEEIKDSEKKLPQEVLWIVVQEVWSNISDEFLLKKKLSASVQKKNDTVQKAKGGHVKYWFDRLSSATTPFNAIGHFSFFVWYFLKLVCFLQLP